MNYDPQRILDQFSPGIQTALKKTFESWQNYHRGRISELESILNSLKILLVHTEEWADKPDRFWKELEAEMSKVRLWTESLKYISSEDLNNKISPFVTSEFENVLSDYPDELRILIGDTYWQIQAGDTIPHQLRKKLQPMKNTAHSTVRNWINNYRSVRHRPPLKNKAAERVIKLHDLLNFYIKNPVLQFLIEEWQRYLQAVVGQLFVLHMNIKEFSNKSLIFDELPRILNPEEKNDIFNNLFELAEVLKNVDENLQALNKYNLQFNSRFEKRWQQISENFLNAWQWAGTFQLKNKQYTNERLVHLEYSLGSRFKKYSDSWKAHFSALRGEWQKDTEISLLRYKTVRNLYGTSASIHEGILNDIGSYFTKVKSLLTNTSGDIEKSTDIESFRSTITQKRKAILNSLQELLEIIHGVNIIRTFESSLDQFRNAVENLDEEQIIFVRQDTDRLPPRSVTDSIPLRELVKKEILAPFEEKYNLLINSTEVEIRHILRVISEIDQLIEFNTESTIKLIHQSGDLPVFNRAKSEMSEGLDRATRHLNDIKKDMKGIPEKCIRELLEYTVEFERDLEYFLESEKLFRFKALQKRRRFLNRMTDIAHKLGHSLKSFFPYLFKKSVDFFKKLWSKYFSLTPYPAQQTDAKIEKIQRFLDETEQRIAKLPFIYQKLYHFQALNDRQFFTNRIREINLLRDEFSKWEKGTASSVAIIGERGSGLTTFSNYIQNEIYKNVPATRIVFVNTSPQEELILSMLCDAFHFKQTQSWDELEQMIKEQNKFKICILENLQFMFLKTVSGFEGIENFLLFLSRTKHLVFWIITCTLYSWKFLEKAIGIDSHFQVLLRLHKISQDELKSIILKRHKASGYHLKFEENENPHRKRRAKKSDENPHQAHLEAIYFNKLHAFAGGNISTAILFWLRSIKDFSKDTVILSTNFEIDFSFLDSLSENSILTLRAILHHEILSPENHSLIFNQRIDKSRLHLEHLEGQGLLTKTNGGYQIHPFIYRPLVQILKNINVLS